MSTGLVHIEHVINGGKSFSVFECGDCSYQWKMAETNKNVPMGARRQFDRPDRSRSS
jgi:hypothetical protein